MSIFWSETARLLHPYTPGEQPKLNNLVKLNTNENPYPPSPQVLAAMRQAVNADLRLYPDPQSTQLRQTIADYYQLDIKQVFVGNGSDEVLALAFATFFQGKNDLFMPDISYSFYPVYCQLYAVQPKFIALNEQFAINPEDYSGAKAGVIMPNPNAPTGSLLSLAQIEQIIESNRSCVVVIDEAYIDFGGKSAVALINRYPNVLVTQTLSKSRSLAGMRVGLALGHEKLIEGLERVKNSFNSYPLDRVAQAGAIAAFEDEDYFRQMCTQVIENRIWLEQQLAALHFKVLPSAANFVFATHPHFSAESIYAHLRSQGVIVRHFAQPRIEHFLRISVGTPEQQQQLIQALQALIF